MIRIGRSGYAARLRPGSDAAKIPSAALANERREIGIRTSRVLAAKARHQVGVLTKNSVTDFSSMATRWLHAALPLFLNDNDEEHGGWKIEKPRGRWAFSKNVPWELVAQDYRSAIAISCTIGDVHKALL
jgi:hypothetical protein